MKKAGKFDKPLTATYIPEKDAWRVERHFMFVRPCGEVICVPAGWDTDLASTDVLPPGLSKLFPSDGQWNQPCVLHDWLYAAEIFLRAKSDQIFKEALESVPAVPRWKIPVMWLGVRLGGGLTYKQHSPESIAKLRALVCIMKMDRPLYGEQE